MAVDRTLSRGRISVSLRDSLAAAALMIDYVLVVAVGISAGVGALVSAVPSLQAHTLASMPRNSGAHRSRQSPRRAGNWADVHGADISVCRKPFRGNCDRTLQNFRGWRTSLGPSTPSKNRDGGCGSDHMADLQAFASGCTAMTGVEAVSNGVKAFREPVIATARAL